MLIDDGLLRREGEAWVPVGDLSELSIPGTIQALLAARLDLLSPEERSVIEPASVIGQIFEQPAVVELAPEAVQAAVPEHLGSMTQKQLVRPQDADGKSEYRFHHILVRDAAYQGILKRARATFHERFVDWAEQVNRERDRGTEFEEIHGYHLEQAYQYLSELGPLDDHGFELGRRGAARLTAAGRRAFARGDMGAAANLLRRAHGLLPERDAARLELLSDLAEAMTEIGEFAWADVFLDEAADAANDLGDAALSAHATLGRLLVGRFGDDPAWGKQVVPAAEQAIAVLEQTEDHVGLAKAYPLLCIAHGTAGRFGEVLVAGERALYHARLAGDRRGQTRAVIARAIAADWGPEPVPSAIAQCEEALALAAGNRRSEAFVMSYLAELEALNGNFAHARKLCSKARAMLEDAGAGVHAASISTFSGPVELIAGDPAGAEVELRRDYEVLAQMGETYFASTIAALLAEALYRLGRFDEAESFTRKAEELASEDDVWTQSIWRCVRAKVLARNGGTPSQAISLAREAIEILRTADAPVWLANGLRDSADVFEACGDPAEAKELLAQALALYERKQAPVPAEQVRMQLARTAAAAAPALP